MFSFRLYDLAIESEWPLPGATGSGEAQADVTIRRGVVPGRLESVRGEGVYFQARARELLLWLEGVARFHVRDGREIVVGPADRGEGPAIPGLLGCLPMAGLLLQRDLLPMQASAVLTPKGAVLFAGGAGEGKSTLAAELVRRGYPLLADDLAAVRVRTRDDVAVLPGGSALRLWPHTLEALSLREDFPPIRPGSEKRLLEFPASVATAPAPLVAIYLIHRGEAGAGPAVRPVSGAERLAAVLDLLYRPELVRGLAAGERVFADAATLVRQVRVSRLALPPHAPAPRATADRVLEDLGA